MFSIVSFMSVTSRQKQILAYIGRCRRRHGFPPSLREMCAELGLASPGSLLKHLRALESKGLLETAPGKKRAWRVTTEEALPSIPLLGRIAAGTPILAKENRDDDLPVDPILFGAESAFALRVQGDSMRDAHIRDGDLAVIRPQQDAEDGEIVAAQVEDLEPEATLKILRRYEDKVELHPANPEHSIIVFRGQDRERVRILGKLIGVIRTKP
jgi:repressor LexA